MNMDDEHLGRCFIPINLLAGFIVKLEDNGNLYA
jgi:hypothetical protein